MTPEEETFEHDVLIVGAGFSGLFALHRMRELGLRVHVLEQADGVGGTWLWNRYPGARCDIESIEYSYSFSPEIQREWTWSEVLPTQSEIERYLNFVADRLDLRRDIAFGERVVRMAFEEATDRWRVETAAGDLHVCRFVIAATGILSAPLDPSIPGMDSFEGTSLFTSRYPVDGFDFSGRRMAIIGTGSTGVQAIPVIAEQAARLHVLQRSAAYTMPSNARPYAPGEFEALQARYDEIRAAQHDSFVGAARISAFSVLTSTADKPAIMSASREEQLRAIEERGVSGALLWSDVLFDPEANQRARRLYGEAVARIVHDPITAAALTPDYPFGCKRPIIDSGYYEAFNRDNVELVDLRSDPIRTVTPTGIRTEHHDLELDAIVYATGFDAMTGALARIDLRGRDGVGLRDRWETAGPATFLGLMVVGFPNLFTIQGPGGPAIASNFVAAMEHDVEWIAACITHVRAHGHRRIEPLESAQLAWSELVTSLVEGSLVLDPTCRSWWNGGNVTGKKRVFLSYVGGLPDYRRRCAEAAADGYAAFRIDD